MRLMLIRHGQTPSNVHGVLDTARPGPGLTELGHEQAARIPESLADTPVDALFASTLVRTQLTANPLAAERGLDVAVLPGLHEIEAGELEGRSDRDSVVTYLKTTFAWGIGDLDARMPGGPDGHDFFGRFDSDIESILQTDARTAALVSHGGAIRVWVARNATNVGPKFAAENALDNTGIVVMEGSFAEGWVLTRWQDRPIGGTEVADASAADPTGEGLRGAAGSEEAAALVESNVEHIAQHRK
ncbi:histidine phosphatase family protein [Salinibacterium hongtaonis]|uniref:histidine phosphatase family protein n=1 Tax=Homoserinimonas hongtaonis TaxID=2079791 RepID=UPI000D3CE244|nr:histidine phosphatase family protein [Salinibacterium hongtaonis]AWB88492.1 histidine phosphatase family protein [Salinibacterium hongtaonis]